MTNLFKPHIAFPFDLQYFAEDPTDPPTDPAPQPESDPPKTFTQEELDKVVADRLARERKKYDKFADYDDVKSKLAEFEKAEEERKKAEMTEAERLAKEKEEYEKKAKESEESAAQALDKANKRLIKAEFRVLARELGVRPDALDDAYVLADLDAVSVDDEGAVTGVKEALETLTKAKPYLVVAEKKQPKIIGEPTGYGLQDEVKTLEQQLEEAKKKRDFGKVLELSNKIKQIAK